MHPLKKAGSFKIPRLGSDCTVRNAICENIFVVGYRTDCCVLGERRILFYDLRLYNGENNSCSRGGKRIINSLGAGCQLGESLRSLLYEWGLGHGFVEVRVG